jgi:hypothetical protein
LYFLMVFWHILGWSQQLLHWWLCEIILVLLLSVWSQVFAILSPAWSYRQKHINNLEMVQRRSGRFVTSTYSREPGTVTKIMQDLKWQTLETAVRGWCLNYIWWYTVPVSYSFGYEAVLISIYWSTQSGKAFSNISYMVFFTYFAIYGVIITGLYHVTL